MPLDLYCKMDRVRICCAATISTRAPSSASTISTVHADVQGTVDFYAGSAFASPSTPRRRRTERRIAAAWMQRKGNMHDLAFTNGKGPRLHHFGFWVPTALDILHLCDVMATTGYLANIERGPGRHGIANAFFLYVRDPDGHRVELFTCDYLTVDHDHEPIRWTLNDPQRQTLWGHRRRTHGSRKARRLPAAGARAAIRRRRHHCGLGATCDFAQTEAQGRRPCVRQSDVFREVG